jgi:glutathione synthase/RimK-type ligase-like ATP-grasp enzyme
MSASSSPIAVVSARVARNLDEDLPPLLAAFGARGLPVEVVDWDDAGVDWSRYALALLRSTWDYTQRLPQFLAWCGRVATRTRLHNPLEVVRWNVDKHYLAELERRGMAVVPSQFVEPGESAAGALQEFLGRNAERELVVKPAIGAGSRDAQRYGREQGGAVVTHIERLLAGQRSVLLQPYLERVDEQGETALVYFDGAFSHAIRKAALLQRGAQPTRALFAPERIEARQPGADELALAARVLTALPFPAPLYARVDLIRAADGTPRVLELELTEPSLFFDYAAGAADRYVVAVAARL